MRVGDSFVSWPATFWFLQGSLVGQIGQQQHALLWGVAQHCVGAGRNFLVILHTLLWGVTQHCVGAGLILWSFVTPAPT